MPREENARRKPGEQKRSHWTPDKLSILSVLIKEKKQLRDAVRRCEEAVERTEKLRNEPVAKKRLSELRSKVEREGLRPGYVRELREILEGLPEDECAVEAEADSIRDATPPAARKQLSRANTCWATVYSSPLPIHRCQRRSPSGGT
ncbi:hypothetical protein BD414DRAFT_87365 [Trametes punicea]|nr:hypothetical protein BD414DRAFT_87365 [Trametes punicea]